jgi:hypothetical protein
MTTINSNRSALPETTGTPVIVVMLRQPRMHQSFEMRSDPFWEFGSFGLTGCHQTNLMHPAKSHLLEGARFAFVQGGKLGARLVYLTPPVEATPLSDRTEANWKAGDMPFTYAAAPVVLDCEGYSDFPELQAIVADCKRSSWPGRFASKFRTRREPLPEKVADQVIACYERRRQLAPTSDFAVTYEQALPCDPPCIDRKRKETYAGLKVKALPIAV